MVYLSKAEPGCIHSVLACGITYARRWFALGSLEDVALRLLVKGFIKEALCIVNTDCFVRVSDCFLRWGWLDGVY